MGSGRCYDRVGASVGTFACSLLRDVRPRDHRFGARSGTPAQVGFFEETFEKFGPGQAYFCGTRPSSRPRTPRKNRCILNADTCEKKKGWMDG